MANNKKLFGMSTHQAEKHSTILKKRFERLPLDWKIKLFAVLEAEAPTLHYKNLMDVIEDKAFMASTEHSKPKRKAA